MYVIFLVSSLTNIIADEMDINGGNVETGLDHQIG
jgi:hypothetical protein